MKSPYKNRLPLNFTLTLIIVLYLGCSHKKEIGENKSTLNAKKLETLVIDKIPSSNKFNLSELCLSVDYVQLDTSVNVFFPNSRYDKILRDNVLFTLDEKNGCRAFDITTGKQTLSIANIGRGPLEITSPQCFYPDLKRKRIEIYDSGKRRFFFYNLSNGDFLKQVRIPDNFLFVDFSKTENGDYIFFTGNHINSINGKMFNKSVFFTDTTFNITKSFFPISIEMSQFQTSPDNIFMVTEGVALFKDFPGSTLFNVSGREPQPILKLDFGIRNIPEPLFNNENGYGTKEYIDVLKDKGYCAGIAGYYENDIYKFMRFLAFGESAHYYILNNKSTGRHQWFRKDNFINDIDGGITGDIVQMDDDRIIMIIEPYLLWYHAQMLEQNQLTEEADKAFKLLEQISINGKEGKPILMIGKLKKDGQVLSLNKM